MQYRREKHNMIMLVEVTRHFFTNHVLPTCSDLQLHCKICSFSSLSFSRLAFPLLHFSFHLYIYILNVMFHFLSACMFLSEQKLLNAKKIVCLCLECMTYIVMLHNTIFSAKNNDTLIFSCT